MSTESVFVAYQLLMPDTCICSLKQYTAPRVGFPVLCVTSVAWLTSFSVIATVPLDIYSTLAAIPLNALAILWSISYWSTQVLTWVIIPVMQHYVSDGHFTIFSRLASALRQLWRFYIIIGILSVAGIIWALAAGRLDVSTLPQLILTLSNTYGLICIIGLLGYGLVEIPKVFWKRSFPEMRVRWHYHRVGKAAEALAAARKELEKTLAIIVISSQQISRGDAHLRSRADELMEYADKTSAISLKTLARTAVDLEQLHENDLDYAVDEAGLASLRKRYKGACANFVGCGGEYLDYVKKALHLEAVCKSRGLRVYGHPTGSRNPLWTVLWFCECRLKPWGLRGIAILAASASIVVLWCEATIGSGTDPNLSPLSLLLQDSISALSGSGGGFLVQLIAAVPLAYMFYCTYYSLFKLGALRSFYHMVPNATWGYSLLLNGSLLARFAAPLCFNYLHVVRMNGYSLIFVSKMGALTDVPLLGSPFNTWFPLIMVVYTLLLAIGVWETCAALFIPKKLRFDKESADDHHSALGMRLIREEVEACSRGRELGSASGLTSSLSSSLPEDEAKPLSTSIELANTSATRSNGSLTRLHTGGDSAVGDPIDRIDDLFSGVGGGRRRGR